MLNWLNLKLAVSMTHSFLDKMPSEKDAFTHGFEEVRVTPDQLRHAVKLGKAYGPVFRGGRRKQENFVRCGVISLDFDGNVTGEEVSKHPLVQEALTILYMTPSSTKEVRRFRMIFALEKPIESMRDWVSATRSLALQLRSDLAAVDGARIFFGSSNGRAEVWDRGLTSVRVDELIAAGRNAFQIEDANGSWVATGTSTVKLTHDQLVRRSGSSIPEPLSSLPRKTVIHCPRHDDRNASAFVVVSASNGVNGIRCSTCGLTYWPEEQTYDFDTFDKAVKLTKEFSLHSKPNWDLFLPYEASPYKHLFPTQESVEGIKDAKAFILNDRYLNGFATEKGITLIKSPKGTGKTDFIAKVVSDPSISVLLVGHRRSLIRHLCKRLNLSCYLDEEDGVMVNFHRYGVCLDSLMKVRDIEYDYIVIDESEQLLAHFLSETMDDRRNKTILRLRHHISKAKRVVALDADLGWTTFRFLNACPRIGTSRDTTIFLNEYTDTKRALRLYESKNHLIEDIRVAVREGKRCYITSNSKKQVERLYEALRGFTGDDRIIRITSDNSQNKPIQEFLSNIKVRAKDFQVILTSPSVSTGVDISFDGNEEVFDHVFGLFEPLTLTHFECDQQLLRVRHPKSVSVFVTPSRFGFETNLDVVRSDLMVQRLMETLIVDYKADGTPLLNEHHPLLDLASGIVSTQRASKNNLKRNFKAYKESQKYPVVIVPSDPVLAASGKDVIDDAKWHLDQVYLDTVSTARQLTRDEMDEVREMKENNEEIPSDLKASYERTWVEMFHRKSISRDLLVTHDRGSIIDRVILFEDMSDPKLVSLQSQIMMEKELDDPITTLIQKRHLRTLLLQIFLRSAGLWNEEGFVWSMVIDTRDLDEFIALVQKHKTRIEGQFDIEVRSDLSTKPVSQLSTLLGFVGLNLTKLKGRIADGDKRITRYGWNMEKVSMMKEISERRSSYPDPWQSPPFVQG
ncbi:MAG: hypothetical protein EOP84_05510 [Verrucomicrobiaceae bacterium]|nr:MAG: hypothetical protein EOP84_05510 [Verrucomicrobiaceae bacterium]